ncbi:hypothetical protein OSTOST_21968, partial [Ostertagia ostertagi]
MAGSAPCSNCNRMLVTSVPPGYSYGFLTMNTYYTGVCVNVALSCSAPDLCLRCGSDKLKRSAASTNACSALPDSLAALESSKLKSILKPDAISWFIDAKGSNRYDESNKKSYLLTKFILSTTASCSLSTWAEWREWSDCSDTCGSCGTRQRFRACNKSRPDCLCEG